MCVTPEHARKEPEHENPLAVNACKHCGQILPEGRVWCDDCYSEHRVEKDRKNVAKAQAVREQTRKAGRDPAHGGEAAKKRGVTQRELQRLNREWEANPTHAMSEQDYRTDVLPRIADVLAREIAKAIGVSIGYA